MSKNSASGELFDAIKAKISRFDAVIFSSALVMALLTHLYMFTNKFINHDDIDGLFSDLSFGLSSGRWLLYPISKLSAGFSSPWLNGLLGVLFLSIAILFTVKALGIKNYLPALTASLTLAAWPVVASTYSYMFCSYQYLVSLALASIGAWLILRGDVKSLVAGGICIALGMGCYQTYFGYAVALCVLGHILGICEHRWGEDAKKALFAALRSVAALAGAMAVYFIVLRLMLFITGTTLTDYQGINEMGKAGISEMLGRVLRAYRSFFDFYKNPYGIFHNVLIVLAALGLVSFAIYAVWCVASRKIYKNAGLLALIIAAIALFPLTCALIYVMTGGEVHFVMMYSFVLPLVLPAVIADRIDFLTKRTMSLALCAALLCVSLASGYEGVLITNRAYLLLDLQEKNTSEYFTVLRTKIELCEGYTQSTPVALFGRFTQPNYLPDPHMTGFLFGDYALNMYSYWAYLQYFHGFSMQYADAAALEEILSSEEYAQMPVYPAEGSIRNIGGVIAVKLGEE